MIVKYSLPDILDNNLLNKFFILLKKECPQAFNDSVFFDNVYGSPFSPWNGGRKNRFEDNVSLPEIQKLVSFYNSNNVGVRLTFTNLLLTENDLQDKYSNAVLNICNNPLNSVVVSNFILYQYIHQNYPNFNIVFSTTMCLDDVNIINKLSKDNILVLNYVYNRDINFLHQLNHPHNIELLCCEKCLQNCPYRKQHYYNISLFNLTGKGNTNCLASQYVWDTKYDYSLSLEEIQQVYLPLGITRFKLNGRGEGVELTFKYYLKYFIRAEYTQEITQLFTNYYIKEKKL